MTTSLRPRYGRIATLGVSVLVTGTAVLGGLGVLPDGGTPSYAASPVAQRPAADGPAEAATPQGAVAELSSLREPAADPVAAAPPVPESSGEGRRVVFDQGSQRVWLVRRNGTVARTYLVSGSVSDNLQPGTYSVFSHDKVAWGIDGSDLRWMVRFATGSNAAIGFHNIPVMDGKRMQTRAQLGTPLSHGCVRQWDRDAKALWKFAPLGTTVVVVDTTAGATEGLVE